MTKSGADVAFSPEERESLLLGKYTRWAAHLSHSDLYDVLACAGEFGTRTPVATAGRLLLAQSEGGVAARVAGALQAISHFVRGRFGGPSQLIEYWGAAQGHPPAPPDVIALVAGWRQAHTTELDNIWAGPPAEPPTIRSDVAEDVTPWRERLEGSVYTQWASHLSEEQIFGVLWAIGEFLVRFYKFGNATARLVMVRDPDDADMARAAAGLRFVNHGEGFERNVVAALNFPRVPPILASRVRTWLDEGQA